LLLGDEGTDVLAERKAENLFCYGGHLTERKFGFALKALSAIGRFFFYNGHQIENPKLGR